MSKKLKGIAWLVVIVFIISIGYWAFNGSYQNDEEDINSPACITFVCSQSNSVQAKFNDQTVNLILSDGRSFELEQRRSASGARYTNKKETIVFWNKGHIAFVTANDSITYKNCGKQGEDDLANLKQYKSGHIRLRHPQTLQLISENIKDTTGWSSSSTQKGTLIVAFKLDLSDYVKTNLSQAVITVGKSSEAQSVSACMGEPLAPAVSRDTVRRSDATFFKSEYAEAGAGNLYQIRRFRTLHKGICYSIEEMVHSTNIQNYPPERGVSEFDSTQVWETLDTVWQTFSLDW